MDVKEVIALLSQAAVYIGPVVAKELVKEGVKDAFGRVKSWLANKDEDSENALAKLEEDATSQGYAMVLSEQITKLKLNENDEFIALLEQLFFSMKEAKAEVPEITFKGIKSNKGVVDIEGEQISGKADFEDIEAEQDIRIRLKQGKK